MSVTTEWRRASVLSVSAAQVVSPTTMTQWARCHAPDGVAKGACALQFRDSSYGADFGRTAIT